MCPKWEQRRGHGNLPGFPFDFRPEVSPTICRNEHKVSTYAYNLGG
jgi:hypothetical protein